MFANEQLLMHCIGLVVMVLSSMVKIQEIKVTQADIENIILWSFIYDKIKGKHQVRL